MLGWLLIVLVVLVGLFYGLGGSSGEGWASDPGQYAYVGAFALLALLYIASLAHDYRGKAGTALRHALVWVLLGAVLVVGYAYRTELTELANRVAAEVLPPGHVISLSNQEHGGYAVRLRRQPGGHFVARGQVDGATLSLLVDTGASTVVLKNTDARRIGINTSNLSFSVAVSTANGTTYAAPIRLKRVAVGPIELRDVDALIAKPGNLSESLLGMSFLRRLRSYEFSGEFLTLRG